MVLITAMLVSSLGPEPARPAVAEQPVQIVVEGTDTATDLPIQAAIDGEVLVAAHRGGYETDKADDAPENTVANIRICHDKGYAVYETDIQRTRDGHFVIMHDATIDRETTGSGKASDLTLDELKRLHKKFRDGTVSSHRVATMEEFLAEGRGRVLFKADLKPGVNQHFDEIMKLVSRRQSVGHIVFRVPYADAGRFETYRANGVPLSAGLLMFKVSNRNQLDDIQRRFNPTMIQVNVPKDDPTNPRVMGLIRYAKRQGLIVEAHAEGTEDDWREMIEAGVRMFHTAKPAKMKAFLRALGNEAGLGNWEARASLGVVHG